MAISIKTSEHRKSTRREAVWRQPVLEMIEPYVKPGVTTANWTVSVTITSLTNNARSPPASATTAIEIVCGSVKWCATRHSG